MIAQASSRRMGARVSGASAAFGADNAAAMVCGDGVYAFCMFVAWGRRPAEP